MKIKFNVYKSLGIICASALIVSCADNSENNTENRQIPMAKKID
jgi:hypothetical protein